MIRSIIGKKTLPHQNKQFLINGILNRETNLKAEKFNEYSQTFGTELTKDMPTMRETPDSYLNGIYKNEIFVSPPTTVGMWIIIDGRYKTRHYQTTIF